MTTRFSGLVRRAFALLPLLVVGIASGCSSTKAEGGNPDVPEAQRQIAEVHKARCGNCHVRVEPGTRTRAQLEAAFVRHRARVHLTEAEWAMMVDYLKATSEE